jgi:hypothetical protein
MNGLQLIEMHREVWMPLADANPFDIGRPFWLTPEGTITRSDPVDRIEDARCKSINGRGQVLLAFRGTPLIDDIVVGHPRTAVHPRWLRWLGDLLVRAGEAIR